MKTVSMISFFCVSIVGILSFDCTPCSANNLNLSSLDSSLLKEAGKKGGAQNPILKELIGSKQQAHKAPLDKVSTELTSYAPKRDGILKSTKSRNEPVTPLQEIQRRNTYMEDEARKMALKTAKQYLSK